MHFPVTLLLFDIDDFKKYNDRSATASATRSCRQTAALMKRCTREHDLVARIGGDEFAVVFWDKEGPRQPRTPAPAPCPAARRSAASRSSSASRRLIAVEDFPLLGQSGKGVLGISAGLAVFPYEAPTTWTALIAEADRRLMHGAKRSGKNTLFIVGSDDPTQPAARAEGLIRVVRPARRTRR